MSRKLTRREAIARSYPTRDNGTAWLVGLAGRQTEPLAGAARLEQAREAAGDQPIDIDQDDRPRPAAG